MTDITRRGAMRLAGALGLSAAATGLLARAATAEEALKIGVIYVSPIAEIGWTRQHNDAALAIKAAFGDRVDLSIVDSMWEPQAIDRVINGMVKDGVKLIFATSFSHSTPVQKAARQNPGVIFEHCSGLKHADNLGTFEAKYYEGTYLAGLAGGRMSKTGKMGFVGGYPIPDIVGPADALLLGAQAARPDMTCQAIFLNSWFDPGKEKAATETLVNQGCDVICSMTDTATGVQTAEEGGAWSIGYASDMAEFGPERHLTAFTLDWSSVYVDAAKRVLEGTWESEVRWLGLKDGVVKMSPYNEKIPAEVLAELAEAEADIASGALHPFAGEIRDRKGVVRAEAGSRLSDDDIRSIDWFVEGMVGSLG